MRIEFTIDGWVYKLKCTENVIGIHGASALGKTKLAEAILAAAHAGSISNKVTLIDTPESFDKFIRDITNNNISVGTESIICIDNIENLSDKSLDILSETIQKYKDAIWIQIGHGKWVVGSYDAIKTIKVDEKKHTVMLRGE